eukprot:jgi/Botrbrau1/10232/Bobra.0362s0021.1
MESRGSGSGHSSAEIVEPSVPLRSDSDWEQPESVELPGPVETGEARQVWAFSSSGWLFTYQFGVVKCLRDLGIQSSIYAIGTSGGACAASYLFGGWDIDKTVQFICSCARYARRHPKRLLDVLQYCDGAIERFMKKDDAPCLNGNMEVSVTLLPWLRNKRITDFVSKADTKAALMASSCAWPLNPVWLPRFNAYAIDGCISDFQLLKGVFLGRSFFTLHMQDAISVSPFYMSRADIKPSRFVPPWWCALPPRPERLQELYDLGYRDCLTWLQKNGRIPYGMMYKDGEERPVEEGAEVPRWWELLRETAAEAPACHEELGDILHRSFHFLHDFARCLAWLLICLELLLMSALSFFVLTLTPLINNHSFKDSWYRWRMLSSSAVSPWVLLKTIPAVGHFVNIPKNTRLNQQLQEHSLLYRVFYHFL